MVRVRFEVSRLLGRFVFENVLNNGKLLLWLYAPLAPRVSLNCKANLKLVDVERSTISSPTMMSARSDIESK